MYNLYKALVRIDADTKLSDKILTLQLIRSARLPEATRISILTNVKWTGNNKIYEETRRLINRSCSTVIKQGDEQASVKLVTDQGEKDVKRSSPLRAECGDCAGSIGQAIWDCGTLDIDCIK